MFLTWAAPIWGINTNNIDQLVFRHFYMHYTHQLTGFFILITNLVLLLHKSLRRLNKCKMFNYVSGGDRDVGGTEIRRIRYAHQTMIEKLFSEGELILALKALGDCTMSGRPKTWYLLMLRASFPPSFWWPTPLKYPQIVRNLI